MQYQTTAPEYPQRHCCGHCDWKLNVLVNKRLGFQNISPLQFRIKLSTDLLLTQDEKEPMEEEGESDSGRDGWSAICCRTSPCYNSSQKSSHTLQSLS